MNNALKALVLAAAAMLLSANAFAGIISYEAILAATNEIPPNGSPATGNALVTVDNTANTIHLDVSFSNLTAPDTAAHIHCCIAQPGNAGVATVPPSFTGFPLTVTSGVFSATFSLLDPSFYNGPFVTANGGTAAGAEVALLAGLASNQTYFNIHTGTNPGGEIRGVLVATPEPATMALVGGSIAGLVLLVRKRRRS
jgi:hypothetical protein